MTYHCASRSDRQDLHTITVENMTVLCSCVGTEWCSHIDATLKHGERHMVPFEEWDIAEDRKSVDAGKRGSVRVDLGDRRIVEKTSNRECKTTRRLYQ